MSSSFLRWSCWWNCCCCCCCLCVPLLWDWHFCTGWCGTHVVGRGLVEFFLCDLGVWGAGVAAFERYESSTALRLWRMTWSSQNCCPTSRSGIRGYYKRCLQGRVPFHPMLCLVEFTWWCWLSCMKTLWLSACREDFHSALCVCTPMTGILNTNSVYPSHFSPLSGELLLWCFSPGGGMSLCGYADNAVGQHPRAETGSPS